MTAERDRADSVEQCVAARELEVLLEEVLGERRPPDCTEEILRRYAGRPAAGSNTVAARSDRLDAGDDSSSATGYRSGGASERRSPRLVVGWLAAGIAAACVFASLWYRTGPDAKTGPDSATGPDSTTAPDSTGTGPKTGPEANAPPGTPLAVGRIGADDVFDRLRRVVVRPGDDLAAVPADTQALTLFDPTDERMRGLVRFRKLASLRIAGTGRDLYGSPMTSGLTEVGFRSLGAIAGLRDLDVRPCALSEASFRAITELPALESFAFRVRVGSAVPAIDDGTLALLENAKGLRRLHVVRGSNWLTDAAIEAIGRLEGLTALTLDQVRVRGAERHLASLPALKSLRLSLTGLDDAGLATICRIRTLESLSLDADGVTDGGLRHVAGLAALSALCLEGNLKVTDAGLRHLRALRRLRSLALPACYGVTDRGIEGLLDACPIESLVLTALSYHPNRADVSYTRIGDATLAAAARAGVRSLDVSNRESVTDEGLRALATSESLESLTLDGCENVTAEGLAALGRIVTLKRLGLESCYGVSDRAVAGWSSLAQLRELDLGASIGKKNRDLLGALTDAGVESLAALPSLEVLSLRRRDNLTDRAAEHLASARSLRTLRLDYLSALTREGIGRLAALETLRTLTLTGAAESKPPSRDDWIAFRRRNPVCAIRTPRGEWFVESEGKADTPSQLFRKPVRDRSVRGVTEAVMIASAADVARLPTDTRAVVSAGGWSRSRVDDRVLAALVARCPQLRYLDLARSRVSDRRLEVLAALPRLEYLDLMECDVTDAGLVALERVPSLRTVRVGSRHETVDGITDRALVSFGKLPVLEHLSLPFCSRVTDEGIAAIGKLERLQTLDISYLDQVGDAGYAALGNTISLRELIHDALREYRSVTDRGLASLSRLEALEVLHVESASGITGAGLETLRHHPKLRDVSFTSCVNIDDVGMAYLGRCTALRSLELYQCGRVTDEGIAKLRGLKGLERFAISRRGESSLTDRAAEHLSRLRSLERLDLSYCDGITDEGVKALRSLVNLRRLTLRANKRIGDAGVAAIAELPRLDTLIVDYLPITDRVLEALARRPALKTLGLRWCNKTTHAGLRTLRAAWPSCSITR